ncbi:hypothetical protein UA08_03087 [Talaromyces atroroseus]|uniref:Rhodopsin domain-containing protein n=1 Tax=Talaromyces atroroseus TaxID=1441469 RepID=A0A225AJ03_TALAT|nr:hypothetical protein UA08_03087 [Talaromyces atroroseus]OKL61462.1 hypothetical protein UA08_03087 [Talaromyces atroroseus]
MSAASSDVEAFTLLSLALAFIIVRIYVRWDLVGPKHFQLDDYLMPLAGLAFTGETIAAYLVVAQFDGLTNSYMTPEERAALDPKSKEYYDRIWGSKIQVIGWSLYVMVLWLVKFSLAGFYSRLTTGLMQFQSRVHIAYALLAVTYLATALSLILSCQPMRKFWQINPDPGNKCQPTISKVYVAVALTFDISTDLFLLSIPLPLLWRVNISMKRKISLMALFSGGVFVIAAGMIRAIVILTSGPDGAVSGSKWACRETFVSIVLSNLPIISPLIRTCANKIGLSVLFSSTGRPSRSHPLSSKRDTGHELRKRSEHSHPLSIPGTTAWDSDEHILAQQDGINTNSESSTYRNKHHGQRQSEENGFPKQITVVQETVIRNDPMTDQSIPSPGARDGEERHRSNSFSNFNSTITSGLPQHRW